MRALKSIGLVVAQGLVISHATTVHAQSGIPFSDVVQKLNNAERDTIAQELAERGLKEAAGEQYTPFIEEAIAGAKTAKTHAENIAKEKYDEVGRAAAERTRDQLVTQLEQRYPDPDSLVRRTLSSVQDNPELYKKSIKGILDADPDAVQAAVTKAVKDKLEQDVDTAIQSGKDFYKGVFNSVMPGGRIAKKFGTTTADVYLGAIEGVIETAERAGEVQRSQVFECLYRDYRARARAYGSADALQEFGVAGFDCVGEQRAEAPTIRQDWDEKSATDKILSLPGKAIRKTGEGLLRASRETSRLGELGIDLDDIAKLIPEYEKQIEEGYIRRSDAATQFGPWLRDKLKSKRRTERTRAETPYQTFKRRTSKVASNLARDISWLADAIFFRPLGKIAEKMKSGASAAKDKLIGDSLNPLVDYIRSRIEEAIAEALGKKRRNELAGLLPTEDYLPEGLETDFTRAQAKEQLEKETAERNKKTADKGSKPDCERVTRKKNKKKSNLDDGFVPVENYSDHGIDDVTDVTEDGCKVIGPAKRELSYVYVPPPEEPAAKTEKADKPDRCTGLRAEIDKARSQYSDGFIKIASRTLEGVKGQLSKPEYKETCAPLRDRVDNNIKKIARVTGLLSDIKISLTACEPAKLDHHADILQSAQNKKLQAMYNRVSRARPVAAKYTAAKEAYWNGNIERSETLFRDALTLAGGTSRETCVDIKPRIGNNLRRIGKLRDFDNATTAAIDACNLTRIAGLMSHIKGTQNPYLDKIYARLEGVPADCQQQRGNAACRNTYGAHSLVSIKEDGSENCICDSGYQWHSDDEGKTHRCITNEEAGKLAKAARQQNCKTKFGAGYYPGTPDKEGTYYCLPTKKTANRWCNRNNKGSGWYAGKINAKGGHGCYRKSSRKTATSRRRTRSKATQRRRPRAAPRRTVRRQPNYDAQAAAAAAAAILQGVQVYQQYKRSKRHRRGGGGSNCAANPRAPGC